MCKLREKEKHNKHNNNDNETYSKKGYASLSCEEIRYVLLCDIWHMSVAILRVQIKSEINLLENMYFIKAGYARSLVPHF